MSYAVKTDGLGWRAVVSPADVMVGEVFSQSIPAESLSKAKQVRISIIEQARDRATMQDVTAHGTQWQADERSQKLLGDAITLALAGLPLPTVWRDSHNNNMTLTSVADLIAVAGAMAVQTNAAYVKSWQLKAQVEAAQTVPQVEAINW